MNEQRGRPDPFEEQRARARENRLRWATVFGRVIVAFGQIEWATDYCLRRLSGGSAAPEAFSPYKLRARTLLKLLEARPERTQRVGDVVLAVSEAIDLADRRNLLAHNSYEAVMYFDERDWLREGVPDLKEARVVPFDEVGRYADRAEALESTLWTAVHGLEEEDTFADEPPLD